MSPSTDEAIVQPATAAPVDAFILAGGCSPWLKEYAGTQYRCLAPLAGKRLVDYIISALRCSGRIRRIAVAAKPEAMSQLAGTLDDDVVLCEAEGDLPATAYAAARALGDDASAKLLGVCDDIPLLTPLAVRDFLAACDAYPEGQLYYPIIPKDACLAEFPQARRTYGKIRDGIFTGGNMMLVARDVIPRGQEKAREIFSRRKSPFKLCNWLGWSFVLKLLCHRLTLKAAEARTSELLEMRCKAIITRHACIGMDIDKPSDLELARRTVTYGQSQKN